jgi:hypothetical protein
MASDLGDGHAEPGRAERPELGVPAELGIEVRRIVALVELLAARLSPVGSWRNEPEAA